MLMIRINQKINSTPCNKDVKKIISVGSNLSQIYQEKTKKKTVQVVEEPVIKPLPQQRHLVTPLRTVWLRKRSPNAANPYTVEASVP